jgi:hypothetical protein
MLLVHVVVDEDGYSPGGQFGQDILDGEETDYARLLKGVATSG